MKKQMAKARKKGLGQVEKKWYWCWYEDKKHAEKKWNSPDGFIPLAAITSVHRVAKRQDQFYLHYKNDGDEDDLFYGRDKGKGTEVWYDGCEILVKEVRKQVKEKKKDEKEND